MVSEEIMNDIKGKLVSIASKPLTEGALKRAYNHYIRGLLRNTDLRDEGVDISWLHNLWEEVLSETEMKEGGTAQKEFEMAFNRKIKPYFKYNNSAMSLSDIMDEDFDEGSVSLNVNKVQGSWDEIKADLDGWIREQIGAQKISSVAEENLMVILEVVDEQIAQEINIDKLRTIELLPQDLVKGIRNIRLTENRDIMYAYWKKVSRGYKKLQNAIRELQIEVRDGGESPVLDLILQLPGDIPNYIQKVPAKEYQMMKVGQRLMDWVATMLIAYESEHGIKGPQLPTQSRNFPNLTEASKLRRGAPKRTKLKPLTETSSEQFIEETERQPYHNMTLDERKDATKAWQYVDPILFNSLQDGLPIAIGVWDIEKAETFINNFIIMTQKRGLTDVETGLKKQLARIKAEAIKVDSQDEFYIPMTSWVSKNYPKLSTEVDKINKKTAKFFKILGDIKLEIKGQERLEMDTSYPEAGKEAGAKTPLSGGPAKPGDWGRKPKGPGLKRLRAQGGRESVKRTDFGSEDIAEKLEELMEIVDDYYFVPILGKSSLFIDRELPDFSHDMEGNYNFNSLAMLFSNNTSAKKSAGIGAKLEANFNLEDLEIIASNLKAEITAEKEPNTNDYLKVLTRLARSLTEWSKDKERSGQFCADQLYRYLLGKGEENSISEYNINGDSAKVLYDGWLSGNENNNSIILDLKSWLEGDRYTAIIKQYADMGVNVDKYNTAKDTIIDSTDETTLNHIPELMEKMLEVHDVVRKMKGKDIVYNKLAINSIDAMDYVITKMETKYNLDITATDVTNIVYSDKSFKNISTNYGFSEDIVYEIKGMFR